MKKQEPGKGQAAYDEANTSNLVNQTIKAISDYIRINKLEPGDRLPSEAALCRKFEVSRTVIREAFRALSALRLIDLAVGKRAAVGHLDHGAMSLMFEHGIQTDQISIQQLYDVRKTLEVRTATLAALRRTEEEAEAIIRLANAMKQSVATPSECMERDIALHMLIAKASKNPVLELIVSAFSEVIRQTWLVGWKSRHNNGDQQAMLENHCLIAQAIAQGDVQAAAKLMTCHFEDSSKALGSAGVT